jgi:hypothetical protein
LKTGPVFRFYLWTGPVFAWLKQRGCRMTWKTNLLGFQVIWQPSCFGNLKTEL